MSLEQAREWLRSATAVAVLTGAGISALLLDYLSRSERLSYGKHTPHLLTESLAWHNRYLRSGQMRPQEVD